ncbi:MAG: hypothetical protein WCR86_11795 [Parabacteroides sp.]
MTEYDIDFLMKLKQLCLEFDTKAEAYPDPDFVGFALYYYATHPGYDLHCGYGGSIDIQTEFCEGGKEWIEELDSPSDEVKTLKLPDNHFVFPVTVDEFNNLVTTIYSSPIHRKNEFFKSESPDWLADVFKISNLKTERSFMNEVTGTYTVEVYPDDELCVIDEKTLTVIENKNKHEKVGIIIR